MKSILFFAFVVMAAIGCDTPESTSGSEISSPPMSDSTMVAPNDTVMTTPVDTTSSLPEPMPETQPEDTSPISQ